MFKWVRARNKKGHFISDKAWTFWNDAYKIKLTQQGKTIVTVILCVIIIVLAWSVSAR
tara:strand:- start:11649 stop:11822 length:174 start_codon:yes stop_codon:yes gene_type:complete